jgi:hypothetical protein
MKRVLNPYGTIGFGLASVFAVAQDWSLPEFCWSTWLAGLVYAWGCLVSASLQIILTARVDRPAYEARLPFLRRMHPGPFLITVTCASLTAGTLAFYLYAYLFAFYGLFLSVFAEMEPHNLFGRNGFINSDFFTPVIVLVDRFWPMAAGILIANWEDFFRQKPWKRILLPFQSEIVRLHVMIVALPFISLLAWALLRESYQTLTIVILMGILYLMPKRPGRMASDGSGQEETESTKQADAG